MLGYTQILHAQFRAMLDDGALLFEVLPPPEYVHLTGALRTLDAQTIAGLDRSKAVVVYWIARRSLNRCCLV